MEFLDKKVYILDPTYIHIRESIKSNDAESLKRALRKGFNVNHSDKFFKTPLMSACIEGNLDIAKLLIQEGYRLFLLIYLFICFSCR